MTDKSRNDMVVHADEIMPLIRERISEGKIVRNLTFRGTSMRPLLREGKDFVDIGPLPEKLRKYDLPIYRNRNGKYVMHRVVGVQEEYYICLGDNTYHREKVYKDQMIGLVCAVRRGKKVFKTDDTAYRLYCRVWCAIFPIRKFLICIFGKIQYRIDKISDRSERRE